jgi:hypothetical protein
MLARILAAVVTVAAVPAAALAQVVTPPGPGDAKARLARALELADTDDIRVLIKWVSTGSDATKKFAAVTALPEVRKTRFDSDEYHIVSIDVGKLDQNLDLARQYGVELKDASLPMLTVLDEHGKVIAQASAPDFISREKPGEFDPAKVAAFFALHQAPAPDALAPFEKALRQAKTEGKLVFVWFSAPW